MLRVLLLLLLLLLAVVAIPQSVWVVKMNVD
jgi:hypothetical protein